MRMAGHDPMTRLNIIDIPPLQVSPKIRTPQIFDPKAVHKFHYEIQGHDQLPHVVKFSGGRSSGMLLFTLLEAQILRAERGDVVVFNNTSAEHPATYDFSRLCKELTEEKYGIPFFWLEAQTYEDSRGGEWTRLPSYRLVHAEPYSEECPDGYHWRGEVFEELLSWKGYVPNQFKRICTTGMKLEPTRAFLEDWFGGEEQTPALGHYWEESRLHDRNLYRQHQRNRGGVPSEIYLKKKEFARSRSIVRPAQRFTDFSSAAKPFSNEIVEENCFGGSAYFGPDGVEYLSFIGIRHDEMHRVVRVRRRNSGGPEASGYEGEHVYMPLSEMGVTKEDVEAFWGKQPWDLALDPRDNLSNCTYCFLKGVRGLQKVHAALNGNGGLSEEYRDTPSDLSWWTAMEQKYGRNLTAEQREIRNKEAGDFIGFFGSGSRFSYQALAAAHGREADLSDFTDRALPCDCTD